MFEYKPENLSMITHCFVSLLLFNSGVRTYVFNYEEALLGDTRTFPCQLEDGEIGGWDHVPVGSSGSYEVIIGPSPTLKYADRFSINSNSSYELVIKNIRKEDAGTYVCNTQNLQKTRKFNLTVLEYAPVCSSTSTPPHPAAENDCGIRADTVVVSCKVNFFGVVPPNLRWENIDGGDIEITPSEEKSTVSNTYQTVVKWNVREYKCMTKELSCHSVISKPLYAFNKSETISIDSPAKITCSANTSQPCSYKWFHQEKVVSTGEDLDLTQESSAGEYRCLAECGFKGHTCILEAHVLTYYAFAIYTAKQINGITTIVLSVVSTIITILLLICVFWKNNGKLDWIHSKFRIIWDWIWRRNRETEIPLSVTATRETIGSLKIGIRGIAIVNDNIYIIREFSKQIESYNLSDDRKESEINVPFMDCPWGMAACKMRGLLYVSEFNNDLVVLLHKIELENESAKFFPISNEFRKAPVNVSVTGNQTVLLSGSSTTVSKVMEYSSDGTKIREILLDATLTGVRQAIWLNSGSILLASAWLGATDKNRICKVDPNNGSILSFYGGHIPGIGAPADIVLNEGETSIFVSISDRKCVLMLNSSLEIEDSPYIENAKLGYPFRLAFDEVRQRLFVGDYSRGIQCINISGSENTPAFEDYIAGNESGDASVLELKKIYDSGERIFGMTILDNRLYTVTANSKQVDEFTLDKDITKTRSIPVDALNLGFGMVACEEYKCLYISEYFNTVKIVDESKIETETGLVIHKVNLETNETSQFPISHDFRDDWVNVSVTKIHNVLVVGVQCSKLEEYDTNGNLLRTIPLDTNLQNIHQACRLDDATVLIAQGLFDQRNRGICKVNSVTGLVEKQYISHNGYFADMLVSNKQGLIFVLVPVKHLVTVFNLDFEKIREIKYACLTEFMPMFRLAIDDTNDKLYVGSFGESQYILVIDIKNIMV